MAQKLAIKKDNFCDNTSDHWDIRNIDRMGGVCHLVRFELSDSRILCASAVYFGFKTFSLPKFRDESKKIGYVV